MNWYIAKVVFKMEMNEAQSQFEEQLRMVEAESIEDAFLKAKAIGIGEEATIENKKSFIDVSDVVELKNLKSGLELYSHIHRTKASREYIHHVHQRSLDIRLSI